MVSARGRGENGMSHTGALRGCCPITRSPNRQAGPSGARRVGQASPQGGMLNSIRSTRLRAHAPSRCGNYAGTRGLRSASSNKSSNGIALRHNNSKNAGSMGVQLSFVHGVFSEQKRL